MRLDSVWANSNRNTLRWQLRYFYNMSCLRKIPTLPTQLLRPHQCSVCLDSTRTQTDAQAMFRQATTTSKKALNKGAKLAFIVSALLRHYRRRLNLIEDSTRGRWILKGNFVVFKSTKKPTKLSLYKQCLHDLHFSIKWSFSPNLSKLARANISSHFMKIRFFCRTVYLMNGL